MRCVSCTNDVPNVNKTTKSVTCPRCVQLATSPPDLSPVIVRLSYEERKDRKAERAVRKAARIQALLNKPKGRGRGWHLKRTFPWEGKFYSYGEEVTEQAYRKLQMEHA